MRKILYLVLLMVLLTSPVFGQEVIKCKMLAGTPFTVVFQGRMTLVAFGEDTTLTILNIEKITPTKKDLPEKNVGRFSISYDKPGLLCRTHGIDPYETYKDNLSMDAGFVFMDMCVVE